MQLNHLERFRSITESGRTAYGCVLTSTDAGLAELGRAKPVSTSPGSTSNTRR